MVQARRLMAPEVPSCAASQACRLCELQGGLLSHPPGAQETPGLPLPVLQPLGLGHGSFRLQRRR